MRAKRRKQKSKFKGTLKKYILLLVVLCVVFLMYVLNTLYQYESSFTDNYMQEIVKDITKSAKKGKITKVCGITGIDENTFKNNKDMYNDSLEDIFKTTNITFKKSSNSTSQEPVYDILSNDNKIITVKLSVKKQVQRLGLFSYPVWEVKECNIDAKRGLYYYDVLIPSDYTIEVNGTKLGEENITSKQQDDSYKELLKYADLPIMVNYSIENYIIKPDIKIKDSSGNIINYEEINNKIVISNNNITADSYEEIKDKIIGDVDILQLAQNWSLFLTDDLSGDLHGFSILRKNLIKNSNLYNMAYAWATSVDITFVSSHTLKNPAFTNTSVTDFIVYSDKAFSCTVTLEKNMKIANGNDKIDKMHDRLYFVYYDDTTDNIEGPTWKLVDMKSIAEK